MKTYKPVLTESILAAEAIGLQLFVNFAGEVCGADEKALGVSELDAASGEQASVVVVGTALITAGAAITVGDPVASDAAGKAVTATAFSVAVPEGATPVTSTGAQPNLTEAGGYLPQAINGYAMDTASEAGDIIRIKLC